jgi:hypothetical protein
VVTDVLMANSPKCVKFKSRLGNIGAGVAAAGVVEHHALQCFAERNVGIFDHLDKGLSLDELSSNA